MVWAPGQSGNPSGTQRPKVVQAAIRRAVADEDGQKLRRIADKVVQLAQDGERWAVEFVRDTLDGKPAQNIELDSEAGPVAIAILSYSQPAIPESIDGQAIRSSPAPQLPAETLPAADTEGAG